MTPTAFERQLDWLTTYFDVVPLRTLLSKSEADDSELKRPIASLTFDDGYHDVARHVLPKCRRHDVVGTVFPVQSIIAGKTQQLWFDTLYRILDSSIPQNCTEADPLIDGQRLSRWVRGPEKEELQSASPETRQSLLRLLAARLRVGMTNEPDLYLSEADLHRLADLGWSIGAHGASHTRFTLLDESSLRGEVHDSLAFAQEFDDGTPVLAYPDGAHDARVKALLSSLGVKWALTVDPGPVPTGVLFDPLAIPRFLCRGDEPIPHPALEAIALPRTAQS